MRLTRRSALLGLSSAVGLGSASLAWAAAPTQQRFVVVILRGALDGMAAVVPYGDPALAGLRGTIVPPPPGQTDGPAGGLLPLGGFFGLHPALAGIHGMIQAHQAAIVHAVAAHYRVRSHFEAQDYLESGADQRLTSGWLNRVVAELPPDPHPGPDGQAVAIGLTVPLLLRGPIRVGNWAPQGFAQPNPGLFAAIADLNHDDPLLGPAIQAGLAARGFSAGVVGAQAADRNRFAFAALAHAAGAMLAAPQGPRIAALEIGGWDTHVAQTARLPGPLKQLDAGLVALKTALGPAWDRTAVLVMTEFGRTARVNGTNGTDHGTATVALVLGGAIRGGGVLGAWPGLGDGRLFENRDLAPTTDLRAVAKGLLGPHLGLSEAALRRVFPGSAGVSGMAGLIRT